MRLNPTDYILLAYLGTSSYYPYQLAETLKEDGIASWSRYSIPHLYFSLRRLLKNGLVEMEIRKGKSRPAQKIYSLSSKGKTLLENLEFDGELLREKDYCGFDLLLGLSEKLGVNNQGIKKLIENRMELLNHELLEIQKRFREKEVSSKKLASGEKIVFQHRIRFLKNEIDFYRKSLKELKT